VAKSSGVKMVDMKESQILEIFGYQSKQMIARLVGVEVYTVLGD